MIPHRTRRCHIPNRSIEVEPSLHALPRKRTPIDERHRTDRLQSRASALSAAWTELSSPRARQYYANRAQRDIQTRMDAAVSVYCAAVAVTQFLLDFYADYNAASIPAVNETFGAVMDEVPLLCAPVRPVDEPVYPLFISLNASPVDQAERNRQAILSAIRPSVAALQLIGSIERTNQRIEAAQSKAAQPKSGDPAKRGRKPKVTA